LSRTEEPPAARLDDEDVIKDIEAHARKMGLGPRRILRSRNFLAVGDADEGFRRLSLQDCELLALDYLDHFRASGFDVALPERLLTIAALANERSFALFVGRRLFVETGALFVRPKNFVVVFDYRNVPTGVRVPRAGYVNLRTLAHEATHQLTFNTGLLNRRGDVPKCIVEGLGVYGEVRKPIGRSAPGQINARRLNDLSHPKRSPPWIPLATLLTDDTLALTYPVHRRALFYAEGWLLIHFHMKEPARLPAFRAYLKAIQDRTKPDERLNDAQTHLGNLDRLDGELQKYGIRLIRALH
jgi:hypothetical protein